MNKKIAIIGFGHMGKALYEGLITAGLKKEQFVISSRAEENSAAVHQASIVIVAVKPAVVKSSFKQLSGALQDKIIISVAAALSISAMQKGTSKKQKIVRIMPNLPVAQRKGVVGFYANAFVAPAEQQLLKQIFGSIGKVIVCKKEADLDALTVLSGSGPAIVAYCMAMLTRSGKTVGLTSQQAEEVSLQTFLGTLALLQKSNQTPHHLQKSVATKGGVTEEIINQLDTNSVADLFVKSLVKGYGRIKRIKKEL